MELAYAIDNRRSIRGFTQQPVSREVLESVLKLAMRAPSSTNSQPWEFIVLSGEPLEKIKQANVREFDRGAPMLVDMPDKPLINEYRRRQIDLAIELFGLIGIAREDREKRKDWVRLGLRFYDAPAGIIIAMDESVYSVAAVFDAGLVTQTICLAALEYGLGTCITTGVVQYPEVIRQILGIPDNKRLLAGITIGYPDWDYPANKLYSKRESAEKLTTWYGF